MVEAQVKERLQAAKAVAQLEVEMATLLEVEMAMLLGLVVKITS